MITQEPPRSIYTKRQWYLPKWENLEWRETPDRLPKCRLPFSGIIYDSTQWDVAIGKSGFLHVACDMMRRLKCEMGYDGPPIDYTNGLAWIEIASGGEVSGCVTTIKKRRERSVEILGAWVRPELRRTGVLSRIVGQIERDGFRISEIVEPSQAMECWMAKNGRMPQ